jgi:hypothetical protein
MKSITCLRVLPWLCWIAGAALGAETSPEARAPIPSSTVQAGAEKLIRELFKADYAKRAPADRAALAEKMIRHGIETADDPAGRYVLFREAAEMAAEAGEVGLLLRAVGETARFYSVDALGVKSEKLVALDPARLKSDAQRSLVSALLGAMDEATAVDRLDLIGRLAGPAETAAKRCPDPQLLGQVQAKVKAARELETALAAVNPALAILAEKPDDPEACLTAGRFYGLVRGDWARALPLLAKGSDAALRELAGKDLSHPDDPMARYALANGWWDLGEKEKGSPLAKARLRERAAALYEQALPGLSGLARTAAERRLEDAQASRHGGSAATGLLRDLQTAVIYANGDDKFILCVNGKEALRDEAKSTASLARLETSLRTGDVLTVRCENLQGPAGFSCAIVFPGLKQALVSNMRGWKCYTPRAPAQWAAPAGIDKIRPAGIGTNQMWRAAVCKASGFNCISLWDEETAMTAYLTLKISDDYLLPASVPGAGAATAGASPGAQWALIQALGDDAFLLAVNGDVVLYGEGNEVWTVAMPLRMGDCVTVRGVNATGLGGFGCAITFPARKRAAVTDLKHWRCYTPRDAKTWYATGNVGAEKPPVAEAQHPWKETLKAKTGLNCDLIWGPEPLVTSYLSFRLAEDAFGPVGK